MLNDKDHKKIESLKKRLHAQSKIAVVRSALDLLEKENIRAEKIEAWKKAAALVSDSSQEVLRDFHAHNRFKRT
jgi:hypothetical protein